MRSKRHGYPELRREFKSLADMGAVINRSESYCKTRLNGRGEFTENEKRLLRAHIGSHSETLFEQNERLCS